MRHLPMPQLQPEVPEANSWGGRREAGLPMALAFATQFMWCIAILKGYCPRIWSTHFSTSLCLFLPAQSRSISKNLTP